MRLLAFPAWSVIVCHLTPPSFPPALPPSLPPFLLPSPGTRAREKAKDYYCRRLRPRRCGRLLLSAHPPRFVFLLPPPPSLPPSLPRPSLTMGCPSHQARHSDTHISLLPPPPPPPTKQKTPRSHPFLPSLPPFLSPPPSGSHHPPKTDAGREPHHPNSSRKRPTDRGGFLCRVVRELQGDGTRATSSGRKGKPRLPSLRPSLPPSLLSLLLETEGWPSSISIRPTLFFLIKAFSNE